MSRDTSLLACITLVLFLETEESLALKKKTSSVQKKKRLSSSEFRVEGCEKRVLSCRTECVEAA